MCVSSASTGLCGGQRVNRCPYRDRHYVLLVIATLLDLSPGEVAVS